MARGSPAYPATNAAYPPAPPSLLQPRYVPLRESSLRRSVSFAHRSDYANEENGDEDDEDDEVEIHYRTGYQHNPVREYSRPRPRYDDDRVVLDTVIVRARSPPRRLRSRSRVRKSHHHHIRRDFESSSESSESAYTDDGVRERDTQMAVDRAAEAIYSRMVGMAEEAEEQTRLRLKMSRKEIEDKVRFEMAEELRKAEDAKRKAADERGKIEREVRDGIEAERKAAAEAKEAEARRDEELTRLAREKMQQFADEIMGLLRERIPQQPEMTRETAASARLDAEWQQLQAGVRAESEAVGATRRKVGERETTTVKPPPESWPSDPRPTHSRSLSGTPPLTDRTGGHRRGLSPIYSAASWESGGRSPPRAPDPPIADSYNDSDKDPTTAPSSRASETAPGADGNGEGASSPGWATSSVSSDWSERRYRRRQQEEAFRREQRERRDLRIMREELIDPLADIVAAVLAGAEYRPRFYRYYHHPQDPPEERRAEPASSMGEPATYGGYNDAGDAPANEALAVAVRTSHTNNTRGAAATRSDADNLGAGDRRGSHAGPRGSQPNRRYAGRHCRGASQGRPEEGRFRNRRRTRNGRASDKSAAASRTRAWGHGRRSCFRTCAKRVQHGGTRNYGWCQSASHRGGDKLSGSARGANSATWFWW